VSDMDDWAAEQILKMDAVRAAPGEYGIEICLACDPLPPGALDTLTQSSPIGRECQSVCPECGAQLFGLVGTEA
jgi:hypothetical protein